MLPLVSILMPVYNTHELFLTEAINSLVAQVYPNIQIIIVDDCSTTTNVEHIVQNYNDSRIILIKNKANLGIPTTRNILLDNATGEYIAFLDSDDIAHPDRIATQVEFLEKNTDIGVVGSDYIRIPKNKRIKALSSKDKLHNYTLFRGCCFCNSTTMIRNNLIKDNKLRFNEEYALAEDYGFWAELIKYTNFANINKVLVSLRTHNESITRTKKNIMKLNTAKILCQQWIHIVGNDVNINENIIINFILGKKILISEWNELERFIIKLVDATKIKFPFHQESRKYIARYLKKYILKTDDYESLKYLFASKMLNILEIKLLSCVMIKLKLAILWVKLRSSDLFE